MKLTWQELHDRFGFDLKGWKKRFQEGFSRQPRNVGETEYFLIFGNDYINPVLNELLCRNRNYPTFNRLVEYLLRS